MGDDVSAPVERYYAIDSAEYERARLRIDDLLGYGPGSGTLTCVPPLEVAPRSAAGRALLAVWDFYLQNPAVMSVFPAMLSSGAAVEITRDEYIAAMQQVAT